MSCKCGYADDCDGETAYFYPLQDGGSVVVRSCMSKDGAEHCAFCGATVVGPCDSPPPDTCPKALEAVYGQRQNGMR